MQIHNPSVVEDRVHWDLLFTSLQIQRERERERETDRHTHTDTPPVKRNRAEVMEPGYLVPSSGPQHTYRGVYVLACTQVYTTHILFFFFFF
jgi:hypothetical protein